MIKLDLPVMMLSVIVPLIAALFLPYLNKKIKNHFLVGLSFILLLFPPVTAAVLALSYKLDPGVLDAVFFQFPAVGSFSMYLDWLSGLYVLGIGVVTPLVAIYSKRYMEHRIEVLKSEKDQVPSLGIYYMFYVIFSISMSGVVLSTNLIQFYIFLKLTVIASFFLILLYGYGERKRTALMYLVWSSIAGFVFLVGSLGFASSLGTFDTIDIQSLEVRMGVGEGLHILIPLALFLGMLIKKAIFGVHIWLPYAHADAPTPVSALLSPNLIGISGWAMVRIVYELFPAQFQTMSLFFLVVSYITMMYGGIMALSQTNLKRLMAYISVSQMGWVVFGFTTMTIEGIVGGVLLFVKHSLSLSILFMSAGLLISDCGGLKEIPDMKALKEKIPVNSFLMVSGFLILLGFPLTMGFWSKAMIFSGATKMDFVTGMPAFLFMAALLLLAGSITAAYAFITLKRILFTPDNARTGRQKPFGPIGWNSSTIPMALLAGIGFLLFFLPGPLLGPAEMPSTSHLFMEGGAFLLIYAISYYLYQGKPEKFARLVFEKFEVQVVDRFYHHSLGAGIKKLGSGLQILHSGVMTTYMFWMVTGFILIILYLLL